MCGEEIQISEFEGAPHIWMIEENTSEELVKQGYQKVLEMFE